MLAVVVVISAAIVVLPLLVLVLSLRDAGPVDPVSTYSFAHFVDVFGDAFTWKVLWNTLAFSFATLVVSLAVGVPAAWLVERTDRKSTRLNSSH